MIFKYGYREFSRNIGFHLLIAVMLAVILGTAVFLVSSVEQNLKYYIPLKEYLNQDGLFSSLDTDAMLNTFDSPVLSNDQKSYTEQFHSLNPHIDTVLYASTASIRDSQGSTNKQNNPYYHTVYAINREVTDMYKPTLTDGKWLNEAPEAEDGVINAVITANKYGLKVGDEIEQFFETRKVIDAENFTRETICLKVRIVGVIKDGSKLFLWNNFSEYIPPAGEVDTDISADDLFNNFNLHNEVIPAIVYSEEALDKYNISTWTSNKVLILYKQGLSKAELAEAEKMTAKFTGSTTVDSEKTDQIKKLSLLEVSKKMLILAPVIIGLLILTIVSIVSLTAINTYRQLKNYGIYYVCGSRWRECALINLTSMGIVLALSGLLAYAGFMLLKITGKLNATIVKFGIYELLACAGILVIAALVSLIMPLSIIGKTQPRDVLKAEE